MKERVPQKVGISSTPFGICDLKRVWNLEDILILKVDKENKRVPQKAGCRVLHLEFEKRGLELKLTKLYGNK